MKNLKSLIFIMLTLLSFNGWSQLTVDNTTLTPEQLVQQVLVGQGVTISNIEFNGSVPNAQAIQQQVGEFDGTTSNLGLNNGIILATGDATVAEGPNTSGSTSTMTANAYNDPDLDAISTNTMNDIAILEFDFVPQGDTVRFRYVFGSEEYNEFAPSSYNDAFGFFISGPGIAGPYSNGGENIALIPGTTTPVTINNVNLGSNPGYYVNNTTSNTVEYDGFTTVLEAVSEVQCGQTYHIKLAIGDAGDQSWDSGVFLEANSFSSQGIDVTVQTVTGDTTIVEGCGGATFTFTRPETDTANALTVDFDISGTATNGTDYNNVNSQVTFPAGEDSVQITINPVQDGIAEGPESIIFTTYIVNACGDTIESEGTIWIVDALPVDVVLSDSTITCPTDSIAIVPVINTGVPQYSYDWNDGSTNDTLWVPGDQSGTYSVDVTDQCGVVGSASMDVTFVPPTPLNIVFNSNTFNLCPGESATATVVNVQNAQGTVTYDWSTGETTQSITTQMPGGTNEVYIPVTVSDGCIEAIDSVKLTLSEVDITDITVGDATDCPPNIAVPDGSIDVTTNPSSGMTFDLTGGGNNYNNTTGSFSNLNGGVNYFLTVTDANGCFKDTMVYVDVLVNATAFDGVNNVIDIDCFGAQNGEADITNITGGPTGAPYTVIWQNQDGTTITETVNSSGQGDAQDTLHGGNWTVTVIDDGGCAASDAFNIFEPDELIIDVTDSSNISCYGMTDGSIDITPSGGTGIASNFDIQWSNGSTTEDIDQIPAGTYSVTIIDDNGCQSQRSITIIQPNPLDIEVITTPASCFGTATGVMEVVVNDAQGSQNDWSYDLQPGGTDQPINSHLLAGNYTMQFFDSLGCDTIISFTITEPSPISYNIVTDPALCRGNDLFPGSGSVSATNVTGGAGGFSYVWTNGIDSTNTPTWGGRPGGDYYLTIFDANGCAIQDTVFLDSLNPDASFTVDPVWGIAPLTNVDVENTSQNVTQNASYSWSVESWQYSTQDYNYAPDTSFQNEGTYLFCLTVTNVYQCVDSSCIEVRVVPPLTVNPPNIFTPNGDGTNDIFHLNVTGHTVFTCTIYNRWGQEIYSWDDATQGWDGVHQNGTEMPEGVYIYTYEVAGQDGNLFTGQGSFHLVRD